MADKELLDYIKLQRKLGVTDSEIHKALQAAGYETGEIHHHMTHKRARPSKQVKRLELKEKHLFFMNIMTLLLVIGISIYLSYDFHQKLQEQSRQMNESLQQAEQEINRQTQDLITEMQNLREDYRSEMKSQKTELVQTDNTLKASINKVETESKTRDATLTASIYEISNESSEQLDRLQGQLNKFQREKVDFSEIVPKAIKSVVSIGMVDDNSLFQSFGSGAIINPSGYVVTNYHVIDEIPRVSIRTHDNQEYDAEIIGQNKTYDLAVLKIQSNKNFHQLFWADSDLLYVGQPVIAIGNPVGLDATVTQGIISSKSRYISGSEIPFIQTDVAINVGNSGGPLLDKDGRIVGILNRKMIGDGLEGLGFAIRANDAKKIANNMIINQ